MPDSSVLEYPQKRELRMASKRGCEAHEMLVKANLYLVLNYVNRNGRRLTESRDLWLDMIQEGNLGLMHAADKFDRRRGVRFAPYAMYWIRQSITRSSDRITRHLGLPTQVSDGIRCVRLAYEIASDGGRTRVSWDDLVHLSGLPLDQVVELWRANATTTVMSLDAVVDTHISFDDLGDIDQGVDHIQTREVWSTGEKSTDELIEERELAQILREEVEKLPQAHAEFLSLRFGLIGVRPLHQREIASLYRLSSEQIRRSLSWSTVRVRASSRLWCAHAGV